MVSTRSQASKWRPPSSPGRGENDSDSSSDSDIPATLSSVARQNWSKDPAALRTPRDSSHTHKSPPKRKQQDITDDARETKRRKQTATAAPNGDDATATAQSALGIVNAAFRPSPQGSHIRVELPTSRQLLAKQEPNRSITVSENQWPLRRGRSTGLSTRDRTPMSMDKSPPSGKILSSERNRNQAEEEGQEDVSSNLAQAPSGRSRRTLETDPTNRARNQQRLSAIRESPQVEDRGYEPLEYDALITEAQQPDEEDMETDQVRQQLEHVYEKDISPDEIFGTAGAAQTAKETQFHTAREQGSPDLGSGFDIDESYNETANNSNEKSFGGAGAAQTSSGESFATQPEFPPVSLSMDTSQLSQPTLVRGPDGMYRDAQGILPNGLPSLSVFETNSLLAPPSGQRQVMASSPPLLGSRFVEDVKQIDVEHPKSFWRDKEMAEHGGRHTRGATEGSVLFVNQHPEKPASEGQELFTHLDHDEECRPPQEEEEEEQEAEDEEPEPVGGQQSQDEEEEEEVEAEQHLLDAEEEPEPEPAPTPLPSVPAHLRRNPSRFDRPRGNGTSGTTGVQLNRPLSNKAAQAGERSIPRVVRNIITTQCHPEEGHSPPRQELVQTSASSSRAPTFFPRSPEPDPLQRSSPPQRPAHPERNIRVARRRTNGTFGTNGVKMDDDSFADTDDDLPRRPRRPPAAGRGHVSSPLRSRQGRSSHGGHERSTMTARGSSSAVAIASGSARTPSAVHTLETTEDLNLVTLPSKLVTQMHKLMGGIGWTQLGKTWDVKLFQPGVFDIAEDEDDYSGDTPAITRIGISLFKCLVRLKDKFASAPKAPDFEGFNTWAEENEASVNAAMGEVGRFVKRICEERLAVLGDSTRLTGDNLERRKALARDLVSCVVPLMVHTLWWAFALGSGVDETVEDDLGREGPRDVTELAPGEGEFTATGVRHLVGITGWLVRLEGVLMFELAIRPVYRDEEVVDGLSQGSKTTYMTKSGNKRARFGKLLREWNGELKQAVAGLKRKEKKELKRLVSLAGQEAVIAARKRAEEREEEKSRLAYEAFVRSTQMIRQQLEEKKIGSRMMAQVQVQVQRQRQYFVEDEDEDDEFDTAREQEDEEEEDPFATPEPRRPLRPQQRVPAPPPAPRYTPWTDEEKRVVLTEIRRTEPGQPLATKQDYEDLAEALDKSIEEVMLEARMLRKRARAAARHVGVPIPRWALELAQP